MKNAYIDVKLDFFGHSRGNSPGFSSGIAMYPGKTIFFLGLSSGDSLGSANGNFFGKGPL